MADVAENVPVAGSPIAPAQPATVALGWAVSARRSTAELRISDQTPLAKVIVRADQDGRAAAALGIAHRSAGRDPDGVLVVGSGPGEWTLLGPPGRASQIADRVEAISADDLVSVFDTTHGRALVRISGAAAAALLAKVCAIDLSDGVTPDGAAFRSSVGGVVTDVVRDDEGQPSYLLHCERSSGQYLFDVLLDAGAEFGIEVDGFTPPES